MKASDVKIGQMFMLDGIRYARIDLEPSALFPNQNLENMISAVDLNTYKIMFINKEAKLKKV